MEIIIRLFLLGLLAIVCDSAPKRERNPSSSSCGINARGPNLCYIGQDQSPIDIDPKKAKRQLYPRIHFVDEVLFKNKVMYQNTGYTVKITMAEKSLKPAVKGGSLDSKDAYIIHSIHFHWGFKPEEGSEHAILGKQYPLEAHVVLHESTEKDINLALTKKRAAVLGILFEIQSFDNKDLSSTINALSNLTKAQSTHETEGSSLAFLKKYTSGGFYTYDGSLTTLPCTEGVRWIIFKRAIPLSKSQLHAFHGILDKRSHRFDNWRGILPLNGRVVRQSNF